MPISSRDNRHKWGHDTREENGAKTKIQARIEDVCK
ncbi:hypothetical protein IIU_03869 [Bacillus cereus VD133]|uniref:Uncharacterized protein n=1 Tax=Bacillus cereus VD133 TaxID=1053233 RepID=A0A9W5V1R6_BACCE|nr:hypothetical protein IIU_03869 [Bacillus cereus VD133]